MRNGSFYDDLSKLNQNLYKDATKFNGYEYIDSYSDNTGVFIALYKKDNEYIFAVKGTEPNKINDWNTNRALEEGKIPNQFYAAEKYYKTLSYEPIIFTGYSLGGSIAQMLGSKYGNETICFEPYGTRNILKGSHSSNIINFGNLHDWVFTVNFDNQIGECYIMEVNAKPEETPNWYWHLYPLYGKPSTAKPYKGEKVKSKEVPNTTPLTDFGKDALNTLNKGKTVIKQKTSDILNRYNK